MLEDTDMDLHAARTRDFAERERSNVVSHSYITDN